MDPEITCMVVDNSLLDLRTAMQWWQNYLLEAPAKQAEQIRNGPLQEIHALQRQLELSSLESPPSTSAHLERWQQKLQTLYRKLEDIGNQLAAPQLTDLALAIQQRLTLWQAQYPHLPIQFDCQTTIPENSLNPLVLLAVDACLQIIASHSHNPLTLQLHPLEAEGKLSIAIQLDTPYLDLPTQIQKELTYLEISFTYLSGGGFQQETTSLKHKRSLNCWLHWPITSDSPLHSDRGFV